MYRQEEQLLSNVYKAPKPKWTQLKNRRLQNWGGLPPSSAEKPMMIEPMPDWLDTYCDKLRHIFDEHKPNHVLINEYEPGQGIMAHKDGPSYFPTICNVSMGSHTLLDIYKTPNNDETTTDLNERYMFSLLLERRSLLILKEDMYTNYMHGINECSEDRIESIDRIKNLDLVESKLRGELKSGSVLKRDTRVSLTIRYVPKAIKANASILNSLLMNKRKS